MEAVTSTENLKQIMHMGVASSGFKAVVVRNSFRLPQRAFWYIGRNVSFCVPIVTQ